MSKKKINKRKKMKLYSLGLGCLVVGAALTAGMSSNSSDGSKTLSPAQKTMNHLEENPDGSKENSRAATTKKNMTYREHQNAALHTLGPKNKAVFHTLSDKDQNAVVETHKKGGSAQGKLTDILNKDQSQHKSNMKKQNYYD